MIGHIFGVRVKSLQAPGFNHRCRTRSRNSGDFEDLSQEDLQEEEIDDHLKKLFIAVLTMGSIPKYIQGWRCLELPSPTCIDMNRRRQCLDLELIVYEVKTKKQ